MVFHETRARLAGDWCVYLFVAVHCKSHTQSIYLKRKKKKKNQSSEYFFSGLLFGKCIEWVLYCNCLLPIEHPTALLYIFYSP